MRLDSVPSCENWLGISPRLTLSFFASILMSHPGNTARTLYCLRLLALKTRKCFSTHSVFRYGDASCNHFGCHGKEKTFRQLKLQQKSPI